MNKYKEIERNRNQTLLIVEGEHEKNELFWLIFKCFPEIDINKENIWVYGTNIYMLYDDIVKEYGPEWTEEVEDVDLPLVISKKNTPHALSYKEDFTNIILVFDYERHDPNFSEEKIIAMQKNFADVTDMGKLYINYPMIESYQHLKAIPDAEYLKRKIPVSLQPGRKYKGIVRKESIFTKVFEYPTRIDDMLNGHYGVTEKEIREKCCDKVLNLSNAENIEESLQQIFENIVPDPQIQTLKYQLKDWITKVGYVNEGKTYWEYVRTMFLEIIYHNICKASYIQQGRALNNEEQYKEEYEALDFIDILEFQNNSSKNHIGYIYVLNTCVFYVADYNFSLIQK